MENHTVEIDDLQKGGSRLLAKRHWKWLDGRYEGNDDDRQLKSQIKRRAQDALRELRFIWERMSQEELESTGLNQVRPNSSMNVSHRDDDFVEDLSKANKTMATMGGAGNEAEMLQSAVQEAKGAENPEVAIVANVVRNIFQQRGLSQNDFSDAWDEFSAEIAEELA